MTTRMIALLRGINVGGHKKVKMADLRAMLTGLGYANVKTVLASGNVAFDTDETDVSALRATIEAALEETFGFHADVLCFPQAQVHALVAADPFADVMVDDDTRLYITFLPSPPEADVEAVGVYDEGAFEIREVVETHSVSVLRLKQGMGSVDAMKVLEQHFGKGITTRNWKTVLKMNSL